MGRLADFAPVPVVARLRVFSDETEPAIISITNARSSVRQTAHAARFTFPPSRSSASSPLERARLLHKNRICPQCGRGNVVPVDMGDGDASYGAMPVPGTATIIGFACGCCGAEWSA